MQLHPETRGVLREGNASKISQRFMLSGNTSICEIWEICGKDDGSLIRWIWRQSKQFRNLTNHLYERIKYLIYIDICNSNTFYLLWKTECTFLFCIGETYMPLTCVPNNRGISLANLVQDGRVSGQYTLSIQILPSWLPYFWWNRRWERIVP